MIRRSLAVLAVAALLGLMSATVPSSASAAPSGVACSGNAWMSVVDRTLRIAPW